MLSRLRPWLLKRAQRLTYGRTDPEDLVQDVLAKYVVAFQEGPQLNEQSSMAWLATALKNAFISDLRKQGVHIKAEPDPTLLEAVVQPRPEASDQPFSATISDQDLELAMQTLSPKQREVFEASARGLRYAEIARQLGIREGAVAKRVFDARKRLRAKLMEIKGLKLPQGNGEV
ncbi:MAG TPA: RNA polymerase sigma factor [Myxococcaceae bacterium]